MRAPVIVLLMFALPVLTAPAAWAQSGTQSEDEQILEDKPSGEGTESVPLPDEEVDDEELDEQVFYSGMGVERVSTDFANLEDATNLALVLGFRVPTFPWVGLEIDLGQTLIPGEYRDPRPAQPAQPLGCGPFPAPACTTPAQPAEEGAFDSAGDEFAMQALGLSLAFKTKGKFYFTGKYGYRYINTSNDTINESKSGNGFGVGVGYRWGRGLSGVELGYKELADEVDSIGLMFFVRTAGR